MSGISYHRTTWEERRQLEKLDRESLNQYQLERLKRLLAEVLPANEFYQSKFTQTPAKLDSLDDLRTLEFTTKQELIDADDPAGFARNRTYELDAYTRFHRTSGTTGRPLIVLDTVEDWNWWIETWQLVLDHANLSSEDRVVMAFSFGPFIGFWSAFDAVAERNAMVVPTGAMSTAARVDLIRSIEATVIFCTPSYALHMAEHLHHQGVDPESLSVNRIIVAGEPGGSIPEIRNKIESAWQAQVVDHSGASEVGPWGFSDQSQQGIYVNELQFIPEFVSIEDGTPAGESELAELILTNLGRAGSPVFRYRTGDLVKPTWQLDGPCNFVLLDGGVLGRTDDMMIIRGVNVFPTSIEAILRGFPEVREYRMTAYKEASMDQLKIEVEDESNDPTRIQSKLALQLGFRVEVECVPLNTLPRFEAKGKRFIDQR